MSFFESSTLNGRGAMLRAPVEAEGRSVVFDSSKPNFIKTSVHRRRPADSLFLSRVT